MLFKYSGKYVNIYFNMKITFLLKGSLDNLHVDVQGIAAKVELLYVKLQ